VRAPIQETLEQTHDKPTRIRGRPSMRASPALWSAITHDDPDSRDGVFISR